MSPLLQRITNGQAALLRASGGGFPHRSYDDKLPGAPGQSETGHYYCRSGKADGACGPRSSQVTVGEISSIQHYEVGLGTDDGNDALPLN